MALLAEYELGCDALPLVSVARSVPEADIEVQFAPGEGDRPNFTAVVTGDPETVDAVEVAFASTAFVDEYERVGRDGDAHRYTVQPGTSMDEQLGDRLDDLDDLRTLYELPVHMHRIVATPTGWVQRGRFADRAAFGELRTFWQRNDIPFTLRKLTLDDGDHEVGSSATGDGLTDAQRAAVRTAYEMGHFDIPRRASLEDVAAELDISASSLSERLRRAQTHLVETHVERLTADPPSRI